LTKENIGEIAAKLARSMKREENTREAASTLRGRRMPRQRVSSEKKVCGPTGLSSQRARASRSPQPRRSSTKETKTGESRFTRLSISPNPSRRSCAELKEDEVKGRGETASRGTRRSRTPRTRERLGQHRRRNRSSDTLDSRQSRLNEPSFEISWSRKSPRRNRSFEIGELMVVQD
jgi:hypothetical protein